MSKNHQSKVYLEPIEHVYIHRETGKHYTSVTRVISSIEEEFDTDSVATAISLQVDDDPKKNPHYVGMTKDRIVAYWQEINDAANEYGTMVHEIVEKYLLAKKWYFPDDEFEKKVIAAYEALNIDEGKFIWPERILFSEEYELAGTTDVLIDIDDVFFDVGDWKTNKEFNYFSKYGKTLLKPFEHLQDCQFVVYTIQLSTYALMYEMETGKKCRQIWVGYFDKKTCTFSKINLMYMKHEAEKLLKLHKYNLELNN